MVSSSKRFAALAAAAISVSCARASRSERGGESGKSGREHNAVPVLALPNEHEPLRRPKQVRSKGGKASVTLAYDTVRYVGPSYDAILNLYNGGGPGPTIRVSPGDDLTIELVNDLEGPLGHVGHNHFQLPNTTNLHTHGPHISGMHPGDDVFVKIDPQERHEYEYVFGTDHMPGTHWYHPHFHGSTAIQVGQGAAGLLIVEDPKGYPIPEYLRDMPEVEMVLQNLNLHKHLREAAVESEFHVTWREGEGLNTTHVTTSDTDLMLVNMQYIPVVEMKVGRWYRWRMVLSSYFDSVAMRMGGDDECEFRLLAKDGIYLTNSPRAVPGIILSPGNRADVAVRCNKIGRAKVVSFDPYAEPPATPGPADSVRWFSRFNPQPEIMMLDIVPSKDSADKDLEAFNLTRPCYLADLSQVDSSEIENKFTVRLGCADVPICRDVSINHMKWKDKDTYLKSFTAGKVQEIVLPANPDARTGFAAWHPYHQHVNPFQIVDKAFENPDGPPEADQYTKTWYQIGDWHDTFMYSNRATWPAVTIRFQTDKFTGHMILHCHLLHHEDLGMMAQYDIVGEEGTVWPGAREIDPMCIRGAYEAKLDKTIKSSNGNKEGKSMDTPQAFENVARALRRSARG